MLAKFDNFIEALLREKCDSINTSPNILQRITKKYTCLNPEKLIYTSCNETGLMPSYNPALDIACEQSTWPYSLGFRFAKNVFCVMCNLKLPVLDERCFAFRDKKTRVPYHFLIDNSGLQAEPAEVESSCGSDEIFDNFLVRRVTVLILNIWTTKSNTKFSLH